MAPRRRTLSSSDATAWAAYAASATPLPGRSIPKAPTDPAPNDAEPPPTPAAPVRPLIARLPPLSIGEPAGGVDSASWLRLRSGRLTPARTLDLHGHTAQAAFHAFESFLRTAHADHIRCIEIITGRGNATTGGTLRRELPLWLNLPHLRPLILAASHPHTLNPGAVRLLLRRIR